MRRVLLSPQTRAEISGAAPDPLKDVEINAADFDALWFARASHEGREAWELRLVADQPYALFEAFEADETEDERFEARREMENRMRERTVLL